MNYRSAAFPSSERRGGRAIKKKNPFRCGTAGVVAHKVRCGMRFEIWCVSDHPVCAFQRLRSFFLMAQPPLLKEEGTGDWPFVRGLENSPPGLGGVPRAINSSLESERRGGRSTSQSYLIESPRSEPNKKGGLRQHL